MEILMKSAPGGSLPIEDIFGRDTFIARMWDALERNSIRMEAERRIGKTCVLRKMTAEPRAGSGHQAARVFPGTD